MQCRVFVCQKCIAETHAGHSLMKPRSALFRSFDRMQESCEALFDRKNRIEKALLDLSQLEASIASETHRYGPNNLNLYLFSTVCTIKLLLFVQLLCCVCHFIVRTLLLGF